VRATHPRARARRSLHGPPVATRPPNRATCTRLEQVMSARAGFDFLFMYWHLMRFARESPFSHSALDIKTYAMAMVKTGYRDATMPKRWFDDSARPPAERGRLHRLRSEPRVSRRAGASSGGARGHAPSAALGVEDASLATPRRRQHSLALPNRARAGAPPSATLARRMARARSSRCSPGEARAWSGEKMARRCCSSASRKSRRWRRTTTFPS